MPRFTNTKITLYRTALRLSPRRLGRSIVTQRLAALLYVRFQQLGRVSDLDEAIVHIHNILQFRPQEHPDPAVLLDKIGIFFHSRFKHFGILSDLEEALALHRSALELRPQGHPDRFRSLHNSAGCLHSRFEKLWMLSDLDEALSLYCDALDLFPEGHPAQAEALFDVGSCFYSRFDRLGMLPDLDEAVDLLRSALEHWPQGDYHRAPPRSITAKYLHVRFQKLGILSDLDEAIALERNVLQLLPQEHPDRSLSLNSISVYLFSRFQQLGRLTDLDEALSLQRNALELRPEGHPYRALTLCDVANCLHSRFWQLGMLSDLEESLALRRSALELCPEWHPDRALCLSDIAGCLHSRFMYLGVLSDLDEALNLERDALELRPEWHPDRALSFTNIAGILYSRFDHLGMLTDLDESLVLERAALQLRPQGNPARAFSLGNVSTYLLARFSQVGMLSDLDEALALQRSALELRPEGHPCRALSLGATASCLHARFEQFGAQSDLNEALALEYDSFQLYPQGHPSRAASLSKITTLLQARSQRSGTEDAGALEEAFCVYSRLSDHLSQTASSADIRCAKQWIQAAEEFKHATTVLAYETFFRLCVRYLATVPFPLQCPIVKQLLTSTVTDAFSALLRYGNSASAVELLELGHTLFWSQLVRHHSPLDDVIASGDLGAMLANKFVSLSSSLRAILGVPPNVGIQQVQACDLNYQLQALITEIRSLPGFSGFLLPPLFSEIQNAAAAGPVIIVNASHYSCDALIVLHGQEPIHVALSVTKPRVHDLSLEFRALMSHAKFVDVTRDLVVLLRELWDVVVFPVVKILQDFYPLQSRIWWRPTSDFSLLPLHAAGSYREGQPVLSDLYISSYTPSLTALLHARKNMDPCWKECRFLIVGQADAPEQNKLVSENAELSSVSLRIGSATTVTCIRDQDANIAKVTDELSENEFVHFACHGTHDRRKPFESGFALADGLLKVEHIARDHQRNALFAYLSACHTSVVDEECPDEVVHLGTMMQFAGFRSVIGPMWAVDDAHAEEIASRFYAYMLDKSSHLDHTRAAMVLHETTRSIRGSEIPFDQQILYIHIGA